MSRTLANEFDVNVASLLVISIKCIVVVQPEASPDSAALRLVRARVLYQMRAPYRPITS